MCEDRSVDLIHLGDDEHSVTVRVYGRYGPGSLPAHDYFDAAIIVETGFLHGRLPDCLSRDDLQAWEHALDELAQGRNIQWRDNGRTPSIAVEWEGRHGCPDAVVYDEPQSMVEVRVPLVLPEGWVDEQRARLNTVRENWPSEVVETAAFTYSWRSG